MDKGSYCLTLGGVFESSIKTNGEYIELYKSKLLSRVMMVKLKLVLGR